MDDECQIEGTMEFLSRKWTLLLIKNLSDNGRMRYNHIKNGLNGISPKTLSERLKELERLGVVKREVFPEIPPRVEYSLTEKGIELGKSLAPLSEWSTKWG
jgi:DNA-binding HxlR family transcriptional regulator